MTLSDAVILVGDAIEQLRMLPAESVQCVVTSPPYYGLRDYGTGVWEGDDGGCDHVRTEIRTGLGLAEWSAVNANGGGHKAGEVDVILYRGVCGKCGARRVDKQIGLEESPDEYVARLVDVFREVRRVLRADGTLWLNLGDSYNRSVARPSSHQGGLGFTNESIERSWREQTERGLTRMSSTENGLKEKDLMMIPAMVAFALRADGWWLRSEIVWSKSNPMPESVRDRPTSAHEKLFLFAKSEVYYYDDVAIRERDSGTDHPRKVLDGHEPSGGLRSPHTGLRVATGYNGSGRNKRNVWEVRVAGFADAHFATFPTALVEPCVRAGSAERACGVCGAPWERVTERERQPEAFDAVKYDPADPLFRTKRNLGGRYQRQLDENPVRTVGWRATCGHEDDTGRSVVLDPFAGSGTVGVVCAWEGREFVGIELNPEYAEMAERRIAFEGERGRPARRARPVDGQLGLLDGVP